MLAEDTFHLLAEALPSAARVVLRRSKFQSRSAGSTYREKQVNTHTLRFNGP